MMMKRFHQFVHIERGAVNSAVINFLNGEIYQVQNRIVECFLKGDHDLILNVIGEFQKENLLIDIDHAAWIPNVFRKGALGLIFPKRIQAENGTSLHLIEKIKQVFPNATLSYFDQAELEQRFQKCLIKNKKVNDIEPASRDLYLFNKELNSCWGNQIALFQDGRIKPCMLSTLVVGDSFKTEPEEILRLMEPYWKMTKDTVKKCKLCELRYICSDCREIPYRNSGSLEEFNHDCHYDPETGCWDSGE